MTKPLAFLAALLLSTLSVAAHAATDWSTQDYDLYPGDFDGDGKTDVLYVAKDVTKASGIALSDGNSPSISFQSWPSNYLGIPWGGNVYKPIVADFNGDSHADVFMQRSSPGDHYLLLSNSEGKLVVISQAIPNSYLGLVWSADQHAIAAGDFNGDSKADLFLQAATPSIVNAVVFADGSGTFTSGPTQSWSDGYLGFKWSTRNAFLYVGDFNGDGKKDLLLQARPKFIQIDSDEISIPIPTYPPNANGVLLSQGGAGPFQQLGVQAFGRNAFGVDFSPLTSTVAVGDFNGDGRDDIVLQARYSSRASYLLIGNASGAIFATGPALANNVTLSADSYRLIAGNFDGAGGAGLYLQAPSPAGANAYANTITGGTITTTTHSPSPSVPAGLTVTAASSTQLNVSWTASTDNVGVTGYRIERCTGSSCTEFTQIATSTATSYSDTDLSASTTYRYRVRANDAAGNLSGYSSIANGTTQAPDTAPPSAPANVTASAISSTEVELSWMEATDNVAVTSYLIERCEGVACSSFIQVGTSATATYSDIDLTVASNYSYRIRATDAASNQSGYSNVANAATQYGGPIAFTYSYDKLGRITQASGSDGSVITYNYDANGNITSIDRQ